MYNTANELKRQEWLRELGKSCDQSCDHSFNLVRHADIAIYCVDLLQNVFISNFLSMYNILYLALCTCFVSRTLINATCFNTLVEMFRYNSLTMFVYKFPIERKI